MDFEKIKPAVEEITLSNSQKSDILNACEGQKRKFNYKPLAVAAAAVAIIVIAVSPGFLFRAKSENSAAPQEVYDYMFSSSEEDCLEYSYSASEETGDISNEIPEEFASLADPDEYEEWQASFSADNGAAIIQFVKYFGISREKFDAANEEYGARTGSYFDADSVYGQ